MAYICSNTITVFTTFFYKVKRGMWIVLTSDGSVDLTLTQTNCHALAHSREQI